MADNDKPRRFRRRNDGAGDGTLPVDQVSDSVFPQESLPLPDWATDDSSDTGADAAPATRIPTPQQAANDVHEVAAILAHVENSRREGARTLAPRPMKEVLGAFDGSPRDQTMIQVLAAASTARHLEGEQSENARRWERLAQDNAGRLAGLRQNQSVGTTDEQIAQRTAHDAQQDKRIFDASVALAMGYVAARGLPAFDALVSLSDQHLAPTAGYAVEVDPGERQHDGPDVESPEPTSGPTPDEGVEAAGPAAAGPSKLGGLREVADRVGRGLAQAVGPVVGDDEVAPNMSPVNIAQLTEELLGGLAAARLGHPRSAKEMLNIERKPAETSAVALAPEMGTERDRGPDVEL